MYVVREGYEGLVKGNTDAGEAEGNKVDADTAREVRAEVAADPLLRSETSQPDKNLLHNLRFGDGELLKDGTCEFVGGRTLKDRYIVRVGWDDVRGWYSQVRVYLSLRCVLSDFDNIGRFGQGGTLIGTARSMTFKTIEGRTAAAHNLIKEGIDALVVCGGDGSLTGADVFRREWPDLVRSLHETGASLKVCNPKFIFST